MKSCTSVFTAFWKQTAECEREEGHKGNHEQVADDRLLSWSFDGAGGSAGYLENYTRTCPECGSRMHQKIGDICNRCASDENIYKLYGYGQALVYKNRIYYPHRKDSPHGGFSHHVFDVEFPAGKVVQHQLVHAGTVPPWYRERMPDNVNIHNF